MYDPIEIALASMFSGSEDVRMHELDEREDSSDNVDQYQTAKPQSNFRPVSPTFLRAFDLIKIKDLPSSTSIRSLKSHAPGSDSVKHPDRKQTKPVAANARAVKKGRVAKLKAPAKKRSHAASVDKPERKSAIAPKKSRAAVAPAAAKPAEKMKPKATPRAPQANDCIATDDNDMLESTSSTDQFRMWVDIIESDFQSSDYVRMLKKSLFSEVQIDAILKSLQHLCQTICRKPIKNQRHMKTYKCTECNFSVSHECSLIHSANSWPADPHSPCMEFITPDVPHMCSCNFTFYHSHDAQFQPKHAPEESIAVPNTLPMLENNRSLRMDCSRCAMNLAISNRKNNNCQKFVHFISLDEPLRKKFFNYVNNNMDFDLNKYPKYRGFGGCTKLCCMMFHRCTQNDIIPIQPHRPLAMCQAIQRKEYKKSNGIAW